MGGVFARIAYGHPEGRPSDFLFYWLKEAGFPTLALTYPLGTAPFQQAWPAFTVTDWAEQSAETIARYQKAHALPAFRRRQEDVGRMATELMALVKVGKIRPTVAEQITLEAIPKALERLAEGHVEAKLLPKCKADWRKRGPRGHGPGD